MGRSRRVHFLPEGPVDVESDVGVARLQCHISPLAISERAFLVILNMAWRQERNLPRLNLVFLPSTVLCMINNNNNTEDGCCSHGAPKQADQAQARGRRHEHSVGIQAFMIPCAFRLTVL